MDSKEEKKQQKKILLGEEVENFMNYHEISAILSVPGLGTFSIFQNEGDKLKLLEHSYIELEQRKQLIKDEVESRLADEHSFLKKIYKHTPQYVG